MLVCASPLHHILFKMESTLTGDGGPSQHEQILLWQQFLDFEKTNPQRLDPKTLVTRVSLAYDQALSCLVHHPEVRYCL